MSSPTSAAAPPPFTLDTPTLLSLGLAFSLLPAAQLVASKFLPSTISRKYYWLYVWGIYDFLTHTIIEGSYLYHCFFSYQSIDPLSSSDAIITSDHPHPASLGRNLRPGPHFLSHPDRNYGSNYYTAVEGGNLLLSGLARLWREYAKADSRWGGADLTVISLELLTVFLAGPTALYCSYLIARVSSPATTSQLKRAKLSARLWFLLIALSTAELYGGFMTFAPEWLSGNESLATEDPVYLWLYLVFFNTVWVWIPLWILWEGWNALADGFVRGVGRVDGLVEKKGN